MRVDGGEVAAVVPQVPALCHERKTTVIMIRTAANTPNINPTSNCHEPTECYDSMCEVQRKASSGKALLLFLVMCMHDVMHAVCMLCAVWRTTDTVICGTE